ncbi:hypothetical protein BofuT4_uP065830.1 [Botrytis cinerea T4]|uniref:Uncharacterized protein n=1 Tax=Botryotinia fuckeliana (strain T4) TaxID=999810 RepID=G2XRQ8_BOTF4|nr:hypothetical protein BofuT4_uP065830.1 [Botrytis cinerea T4]
MSSIVKCKAGRRGERLTIHEVSWFRDTGFLVNLDDGCLIAITALLLIYLPGSTPLCCVARNMEHGTWNIEKIDVAHACI